MKGYKITVPATCGNVGPGFDCFGCALTLYNHFEVRPSEELKITASGAYADRVAKNKHNLVYQSFEQVFTHLGMTKPIVSLHIDVHIPLSRGLGSSATAAIGGLMAGNALAGSPLSALEILQLATNIEGHPDNVAPAVLGGCQLVASSKPGEWQFCSVPWHESLVTVVAIPEFELSTAKARQILPKEVPLGDAVFNCAHLGILLQGLSHGQAEWVRLGLKDRLHQPYRQSLIPGMERVQTQALEAGALGVVISGAGPTLLAVATPAVAPTIGEAMVKAWQQEGIKSVYLVLDIDRVGTVVTEID
ncbi:MAG: homoserine kinase [Pseudanabaenaceae cyanobacterium SKYGB_i_bin29]|nr:homoserine kinase [Pseudanabaenaceae cyanobacterium SKYG29]MDW8421287.1 homoserine kinase [Pseudanabaenaceae cyanobacterium SKYGB_i_bin29]